MTQTENGLNGIGDDDIDENGQADAAQDMAETGGSGGDGLTRHEGDGLPASAGNAGKPVHPPTESGALGAEDTREAQAGVNTTGLGSAETGANQAPDDLPP